MGSPANGGLGSPERFTISKAVEKVSVMKITCVGSEVLSSMLLGSLVCPQTLLQVFQLLFVGRQYGGPQWCGSNISGLQGLGAGILHDGGHCNVHGVG